MLYSVWLSNRAGAYLWAHASHASGGIHPHWTPHVRMSCGETQIEQHVSLAPLFRPSMRPFKCGFSEIMLHVRQYLEVWWGPGCLAGEAVTLGCSQEADLAYGGRALGHLGTAETWMAAGKTGEGWELFIQLFQGGILVLILDRQALKYHK